MNVGLQTLGTTNNVTLIRDSVFEDIQEVGSIIQLRLMRSNTSINMNNVTLNRVTSIRGSVKGNGFKMVNILEGNGTRIFIRNSTFSQFNTLVSDGVILGLTNSSNS